jgi:hypothetical protein
MNDEQLARNLRSIGKACFVKYFELFASEAINRVDVIETLKTETPYTEKSCISRTSHAQSIIKAGFGKNALKTVANSNSPLVSEETCTKAKELIISYYGK